MKKNVASQTVSAVVVSATDGSAITSSVSITVNGDAGTQGAGGGTLTHEGGGEWSYVPTQAETNFDHIMFKFSGTGAIPVGVQVYTEFPQTGDSFARIGVAGAGLTNIDLPDQTMNMTGNITGNLSGSVGSVTGAVGSVTGAVGSVTGNVGGSVASLTTNNDKTGYALTAAYDLAKTASQAGDAMTLTSAYNFAKGTTAMTEAYAANGAAPTPVQAIMAMHQMLMDFAISGTSYTVKKLDNATTAFVVTLNDATSPTATART